LKFCEFFFEFLFFFFPSNVGEFLQKEKASKLFFLCPQLGGGYPGVERAHQK
jgi:hypothetical protein